MFASKNRSKKKAQLSGNNTVQPKLKIGQPGDKYEQEADRLADAVMRMPDPQAQMQPGRKDRLQMSPTIQQQSFVPQIQMMRPCPPTLTESEDTPEGWKDYQGNACVFHCCYRGILEDRMPEPDNPQNECFYDSYGRLVDENHENADCGGTPNQYDSDRNPLKHTFLDEGGILSSGWSAFWESRFRSEDRSDRERAHAHEECVKRLGGCSDYRPAGFPTSEEIETYNDRCREESNFEGPNITPDCN